MPFSFQEIKEHFCSQSFCFISHGFLKCGRERERKRDRERERERCERMAWTFYDIDEAIYFEIRVD